VALKLRIVGLGDSTTAGTPGFLSPREAPPNGKGNPESQYVYWMMRKRPEWTVLNRGVNGERSDQIEARFERDVVDENPNYVIILAGVNDIYQGTPLDSVKRNLLNMYEQAMAAGIRPVAATVLPYNTASKDETQAIHSLNNWIKATASKLAISFCDSNGAVRDPSEPDRLSSSKDGLHPDVEGYRKMAEALCTIIDNDKAHQVSNL
jgi:acyl-CoA thioesterase-1